MADDNTTTTENGPPPERTAIVQQAPTSPAQAPAVQIPRAPAPVSPDLVGLLRAAATVRWEDVDLDVPQAGYLCTVGAQPIEAAAVVRCDCGERLIVPLDGCSRAKCPHCGAIFRHVCLVQREDMTPSTPALLIGELLRPFGGG